MIETVYSCQDKMKHSNFLLWSAIVLLFSIMKPGTGVSSQCPSGSLPVRVRGETVSECSTTSSESLDAVQALNSRVDAELDALLPRIQEFLTPSPCNGPGWKRVVYIDMKDTSHSCPANSGWTLFEIDGKRLCRRNPPTSTCGQATFEVDDVIGKYNKVCGRVIAYKWGSTEAFGIVKSGQASLGGDYVDGVSITHGRNQTLEHIWSFAAGSSLAGAPSHLQCPCEGQGSLSDIPPFIPQDHFFCETGGRNPADGELLSENPLWDGSGCDSGSSCCTLNDPPHFVTTLSEATCDSIDVRLCGSANNEDTPIELIELYVK